ncbi:MAG: tryptophan--tRNA ligase [Candidatus Omnitrophica bacterium]|nr:tryptophan--tRNA ligase [Candidatus Omnitrophota bacterium]
MSDRILSGMRPTGKLHLGHLLGALENWKKFQGKDTFFMIADWHAFSSEYDSGSPVRGYVNDVLIDYLASGLDPAKCTIFVQSHVPEHAELDLLFSMITPLGWLSRNPTYKEQIRELKDKELHTHGFLGYPVLQAADILLYKANKVPVGEDQLPHLELTREIARRFNSMYKEIFPEPEAILTDVPRLPGTDGRKMSKSYNNAIYLSDSPETVDKKVKEMITDPARKRRNDKGHPEVCSIFYYQKLFNPGAVAEIDKTCRSGELGCVDCKKALSEKLRQFLAPVYEKRCELEKDRSAVESIIEEGDKKARWIAAKTFEEAKQAAGL